MLDCPSFLGLQTTEGEDEEGEAGGEELFPSVGLKLGLKVNECV